MRTSATSEVSGFIANGLIPIGSKSLRSSGVIVPTIWLSLSVRSCAVARADRLLCSLRIAPHGLELTGLLAVQAGLVRCFEIMSEEDGDGFTVGTGCSAEILIEFTLVLAGRFFCLVWGFAVRGKS